MLPRDAVAGIPTDYANTIIDNMLSLLATITTTDDLLEVWRQAVTDTEVREHGLSRDQTRRRRTRSWAGS